MRPFEIGLATLLLASSGLNFLLLKKPLVRLISDSWKLRFPQQVPAQLVEQMVSGRSVTLDLRPPAGAVFYLVDPVCIWYQRNKNAFGLLNGRLNSNCIETYVVSRNAINLQVVVPPEIPESRILIDSGQMISRLLFSDGTPQTILINRDGHIVKRWEGAYTQDTASAIGASALSSLKTKGKGSSLECPPTINKGSNP